MEAELSFDFIPPFPWQTRTGDGRSTCAGVRMAEFVGRCAAALAGPLAAEEELLAWANSLAASPDDFSDAYQRSLSEPISTGNASTVSRTGARRKNAGVYYTPTQLVEPLLDETIPIRSLGAGKRDSRPTVCDPACGTGNFLIAAAERLLANSKSDELPDDPKIRQRICRHQIFGVDLDEGALAIARFRLWLWAGRPEGSLEELTPGLQVADALTDPFAGRRFDVVLGNPPFANAIEDRVDAATKARLRRDFPGLGGTADLSYYFLALADRIAKPAGKIGLVLPRTILTGPSAGRLRRDLLTRRPPTFMHAPTNPFLFCDANVFVVLLGFGGSHCTASIGAGTESTRHAIRIDSVNWWAPISKLNNPASAQTNDDSKSPGPTLGEQFEVFASMTTAMAYELREFLYDDDKVVVESAPLRVAANPIEGVISTWGILRETRVLFPRFARTFEKPHKRPGRPARAERYLTWRSCPNVQE